MKKFPKILSCVTACALTGAMLPLTAAATANDAPQVRVIIENHTLSAQNGASWTGTLADEWVTLEQSDDAVSAFMRVLEQHGYTQTGADFGYITEINGLASEDGGDMGSWMISLDNWFTDEGIGAYTVSSGKLENGDELRFSFSCSWGTDLGYDWSGSDTSLQGIDFSAGSLDKTFAADQYDYTILLPEGTVELTVRPDVKNKSYRAKVYKNTYTPAEAGTDYKPSQAIAVEEGDVLIVGVANAAWMQANYNNASESVYRFHINVEQQIDTAVQEAESLIAAIGTVTEASEKAIADARSCYNALTDEQKKQVSNYALLTEAEKTLSQLRSQQKSHTVAELREVYQKTAPQTLTLGNEWDVINLARMNLMTDSVRKSYVESVRKAVAEQASDRLSSTRATVNAGVVTALSALGVDPTDFEGYNLLAPLADMDYVTRQGINGAVYTLIALDTKGYAVPAAPEGATPVTRDALITAILNEQQPDGGWTIDTWSGVNDGSDADMTAMALQALAPYADRSEVSAAVQRALAFLSEQQDDHGRFISYGSYDCESAAQVIIALTALRIPMDDARFVKDGRTAFDGLLEFYVEKENAFSHYAAGDANAISTYQAFTAVAALYRSEQNMTTLFDFSDTAQQQEASSQPEQSAAISVTPDQTNVRTGDEGRPAVWVLLTACSLTAGALLLRKKRA